MKIYSMTATFGKLDHATLTLQPGLNLIEAPNEWGKSTWCAFLAAMLYGIDTRERTTATALAVKERYAPWSGAPMQGRMDIHWNGRDITIERRTKGRAIFGDFKAYETMSGIAVPELTAENCGKLLLGVEKSVFTRTGFIRLADMPVTQDEALRRRLNELVTTGDESGQSDALAQKLRDLKNKVRSNRANGLIPQALAQKQDLENKLRQLDSLQGQSQQLHSRQAQAAEFSAQLANHKQALDYAAARDYAQKAADARARLAMAEDRVDALEETCRSLPTEEALLSRQQQARQLHSRKDTLQLELAMLPAAPAAPQSPVLFPENAREQAQRDYDAYQELSDVKVPARGLRIAAFVTAAISLAGLILTFATLGHRVLPLVGTALLYGFGMIAAFCGYFYRRQAKARKKAQQQIDALTDRYAPLPPEQWVRTAQEHTRRQAEYSENLAVWEQTRADLQQQLQQVLEEIAQLPAEDSTQALQLRRELADARREQAHLHHLVQTLASVGQTPEPPDAPDTLTYSAADTARLLSDADAESRQLLSRLSQLSGQMQALGSRETLENALAAVNARLGKLEQTYAALELAQATLTEAATALQRRFAPAIAKQAQAYFAAITGSRYDRLALDNELGLHAAARDEDTLMSALWRSDGTVDQLYLALRLAVADALTPAAPLVLDDALVRFDDTRLAAALALLKQSAAHRQVILFTCQTRERQLTMDN